ncbi:MAG: hypothetical protein SWH78_12765 [Thermodesulfobacteriota bacterium]|nr:hypothetical protein [Thermodesulfobacteriota bacterium]
MAKRRDIPSRRDVNERLECDKRKMEAKETDLDKIASDVETVRRTLERLDFRGTAEGSREAEESIEGAEDVATDAFDKEDGALERIQTHNREFGAELDDRKGASESDLKKVTDVTASINRNEVGDKLKKAKEAVLSDVNFLAAQIERARAARERSDAIQERLKGRVQKGRRKR